MPGEARVAGIVGLHRRAGGGGGLRGEGGDEAEGGVEFKMFRKIEEGLHFDLMMRAGAVVGNGDQRIVGARHARNAVHEKVQVGIGTFQFKPGERLPVRWISTPCVSPALALARGNSRTA